jgi:hypothetical protein
MNAKGSLIPGRAGLALPLITDQLLPNEKRL